MLGLALLGLTVLQSLLGLPLLSLALLRLTLLGLPLLSLALLGLAQLRLVGELGLVDALLCGMLLGGSLLGLLPSKGRAVSISCHADSPPMSQPASSGCQKRASPGSQDQTARPLRRRPAPDGRTIAAGNCSGRS